ncbi:decarboxylating 6-phosphogluconate dehydrogenase [Candidatus Berkelbacteria bacterium]|nr:decarboxylating 6-phosphogluconate dehydrogenase [Candidatus Berkelbacteria bacterium]
MTLGMVGLGKMGGNLARQLTGKGFHVVGYNRTVEKTLALADEGIEAAMSLEALAATLPAPRIIWIMLTAGSAVDEAIATLQPHLERNDVIIDGGNSFYKDAVRRAAALTHHGIRFVDVGVSGGPARALAGACLMVGGDEATFRQIEPIIRAVSVPDGYAFFPGIGTGHFVKMVHNGIEYGMMQAIAEGFEVMKASHFKLDLTSVASVYNHGSVIESQLVGWLKDGYDRFGTDLADVSSTVAHTGEGAWTVQTARELGVPVPIIEGALAFRKRSATEPRYTGKVLSALRAIFGGHAVWERPD